MKNMKLKTKLIIGAIAIALFILAVSITGVTLLISRQHRDASQKVITHAVNVIRDDIESKRQMLLNDAEHMASINGMGTRIKFLSDEKDKGDISLTENMYHEAINDLYNVALSNNIWKVAVYDRDNDLIAFMNLDADETVFGYPQKKTASFRIGHLQPGGRFTETLWKEQKMFSDVNLHIKNGLLNSAKVHFEAIQDAICLVACVPLTASVYNQTTEMLETTQVGALRAVYRIGREFIRRMTQLTDNQINVFTPKGLSVGSLENYTSIDLTTIPAENSHWGLNGRPVVLNDVSIDGSDFFQVVLPFHHDSTCIGVLACLYSKAIVKQNTKQVMNLLALLALICLFVIIPIAFLFSRSLTNPIASVVEGLKDIAKGEGDLTNRLEVRGRDEVGELANWFNIFIKNLQETIKVIVDNSARLDQALADLSELSGRLAQTAEESKKQSDSVSVAAEEMSSSMDSVANTMKLTYSNVEAVDTSSEEMTSTINEIARNSEQASGTTKQAVTQTKSTTDQVNDLGKATEEISQITEAIKDISDQTNLLALNATIEAARAGEAGKGFTVVANEIKELARQTTDATGRIKDKIEKIQHTTQMTISRISEVSGVIHNVDEIVLGIAGAIEEQSLTTKEISNHITQATQGILTVNNNISESSIASGKIAEEIAGVHMGASEMSNACSQMNSSVNDLSRLFAELRKTVERFRV